MMNIDKVKAEKVVAVISVATAGISLFMAMQDLNNKVSDSDRPIVSVAATGIADKLIDTLKRTHIDVNFRVGID